MSPRIIALSRGQHVAREIGLSWPSLIRSKTVFFGFMLFAYRWINSEEAK